MPSNATFTFNRIYQPVFNTKARYILICGGRGRGGSHFGTDYFRFKMEQPEYFRGAIMRAIYGDLRGSLWQDFKDRIDAGNTDADYDLQESRMSAQHKETGNSFIAKGFKKSSSKQSAKLKSLAGMTHILIEELEEVEEDDFDKLDDSLRTDKVDNIQIVGLFNMPSKNHWIIRRFFNLEEYDAKANGDYNPDAEGYYTAIPKENENVLVIHSTYLDNLKNLNQSTIDKYKEYGRPGSPFYKPTYYYCDVKGLVPEGARGRIYKGWKPITNAFFDSLPYESYFGLDFGYSDDPVALVEIKSHNNRNFWRQHIYESGLTNPALARKMRILGISKKVKIYADSSEPKSIQELKDEGFNVIAADKGPDSVLFGIKAIQGMENYYTEDSKDLIHENQEYKWDLDANKQPTNTPIGPDHLKDAGRYAITTHRQLKRKRKIKTSNPTTETSAAKKKNPLDWIGRKQ